VEYIWDEVTATVPAVDSADPPVQATETHTGIEKRPGPRTQARPGRRRVRDRRTDPRRKVAAADVPPSSPRVDQPVPQAVAGSAAHKGVLTVVWRIVIVAVVFEIITPQQVLLRPSNLVYIFGEQRVHVLAIAER